MRLYHGTPALLAPGDTLTPGTAATSPYGRDEAHVYLTTSVASAHQWALDATEMRGATGDPVHVYEVTATATPLPHDDDPDQHVAPTATIARRVR